MNKIVESVYKMSNNLEQYQVPYYQKQELMIKKIERQLMKDIEQQLQTQTEQKYKKAIQQIQKQALQQYEQAIRQLQESRNLLQNQKQQQIQKQIESLQLTLCQLQQQRLMKLQQKYLQQNFDSHIMSHSRIIELQKQIQEQIYEELEQKHEVTKQRQLKQLIIAHQTKQIKLRKQLDIQIKSRIYCSSGLQQLKQQIKQSKTQIGSQKSQYNLKLKKIQGQIKEYQDKLKQYQKLPDIQQLRQRYQQLKVQQLQKQTQKQLQKEEQNRFKNTLQNQQDQEKNQINYKKGNTQRINQFNDDDSLDQNQYEENQRQFIQQQPYHHQNNSNKTLKRQSKNTLLSQSNNHYLNQNSFNPTRLIDSSLNSNPNQSQQNSKKFDLTAYFKGYLLNSQTVPITQSQDIVKNQSRSGKKSLLNLNNVSQLLKQKITMDPLQRYLNKNSVSKQNDINANNMNIAMNQKCSNFAQLYEQHLKNLNKGFAKKSQKNKTASNIEGISQMAKKIIIKNLANYHKKNFMTNKNENNSKEQQIYEQHPVNTNLNPNIIDSYHTYQSNLLASYK